MLCDDRGGWGAAGVALIGALPLLAAILPAVLP